MSVAEKLEWSPSWSLSGWVTRIDAALADASDVRAHCTSLAAECRVQRILRGGMPYLDRYTLADEGAFGRIYLHHFLAGDQLFHDHPWRLSRSVILAGGYIEHRPSQQPATYTAGNLNTLRAGDYHRIDLIESDAWTLFSTGIPLSPPDWRFIDPSTGRRVHHREMQR